MGTSFHLHSTASNIDNDVTVACQHDHPGHEALIDKDVSVVSRTEETSVARLLGLKEEAG